MSLNFIKSLKDNVVNTVKKDPEKWSIMGITWGLPAAIIPTARLAQDTDKPQTLRKELFWRDLSSYVVGLGAYITAFGATAAKLTKNSNKMLKNTTPVAAGTVAFSIWSGVFAPKICKAFGNKCEAKKEITDEALKQPEKIRKLDIREQIVMFAQNKPDIYKRAQSKLNPYSNLYDSPLLKQLNSSGRYNLKI